MGNEVIEFLIWVIAAPLVLTGLVILGTFYSAKHAVPKPYRPEPDPEPLYSAEQTASLIEDMIREVSPKLKGLTEPPETEHEHFVTVNSESTGLAVEWALRQYFRDLENHVKSLRRDPSVMVRRHS